MSDQSYCIGSIKLCWLVGAVSYAVSGPVGPQPLDWEVQPPVSAEILNTSAEILNTSAEILNTSAEILNTRILGYWSTRVLEY